MTASQYPRSSRHRFLYVGIEGGNGIGIGQRTELRVLVEWISHPQILHAPNEQALELVGNFLGNNEAFGCNTGLAVILNARVDGSRDGFSKICARHHNEGITATQFQNNLLDAS